VQDWSWSCTRLEAGRRRDERLGEAAVRQPGEVQESLKVVVVVAVAVAVAVVALLTVADVAAAVAPCVLVRGTHRCYGRRQADVGGSRVPRSLVHGGCTLAVCLREMTDQAMFLSARQFFVSHEIFLKYG
jgi:hypothetical protein